MPLEAMRRFLHLPTKSQWRGCTLPTKQTTISYVVAIASIIFAFISWRWPYAPIPPAKAYDLDAPRRAKFLSLLQIPSDAHFRRLRIGCTAWSEASCIAAGNFLKLFSEAGWQIEEGRVFKMEPSIPVNGMTIASRNDRLARLPQLPPHLGRWAKANVSASVITVAFRFMDNPVNFSSDPELADDALGVYFGPEPLTHSMMPKSEKEVREPLLRFIKSGEAIKNLCSGEQTVTCSTNFASWSASVSAYLKASGLSQKALDEWGISSNNASAPNIEKKQDSLILLSLKVGDA